MTTTLKIDPNKTLSEIIELNEEIGRVERGLDESRMALAVNCSLWVAPRTTTRR